MNKTISKIILAAIVLASSTTVAHAVTGTWTGEHTDTKIRGQLYLMGGYKDQANASTQNLSQNGKKVYLQLYCYETNGIIDQGSVRTAVGTNKNPHDVGVSSSTKRPKIWESLHSTSGTADPYYGLRIQL